MQKKDKTTGIEIMITCVLREEIIFEIYRKVPLLVPSYGYPPEPPECREELSAGDYFNLKPQKTEAYRAPSPLTGSLCSRSIGHADHPGFDRGRTCFSFDDRPGSSSRNV